ncbi:MAG: hypothetical protein BGO41_07065 [Clostridiales bacterium 38-18]|nr:MAG: hypothetical protein BGO41_07065 [Clostridiales bacterium 38-18]
MNPIIIIPAYNPNHRLIELVDDLIRFNFNEIIIVNDGSEVETLPIFESLSLRDEVILLHHGINLGKGAALKTAFEKIKNEDRPCITVDADGQHAPKDIFRIAQQLIRNKEALILGVRNFDFEQVPFKSKWGNKITSKVFKWSTGSYCSDTQTGLRGFQPEMLQMLLEVEGDRYEYEMNVLLEATKRNLSLKEVQIETLYFEENKGSHFNPFTDSLKIYGVILRYSLSAITSAIVDIGLFAVLTHLVGVIPLVATVLARLISGGFNFKVNQSLVFESKGKGAQELRKYTLLFFTQMMVSASLVQLITMLTGTPVIAKILVDSMLFIMSYWIQRRFIFN